MNKYLTPLVCSLLSLGLFSVNVHSAEEEETSSQPVAIVTRAAITDEWLEDTFGKAVVFAGAVSETGNVKEQVDNFVGLLGSDNEQDAVTAFLSLGIFSVLNPQEIGLIGIKGYVDKFISSKNNLRRQLALAMKVKLDLFNDGAVVEFVERKALLKECLESPVLPFVSLLSYQILVDFLEDKSLIDEVRSLWLSALKAMPESSHCEVYFRLADVSDRDLDLDWAHNAERVGYLNFVVENGNTKQKAKALKKLASLYSINSPKNPVRDSKQALFIFTKGF